MEWKKITNTANYEISNTGLVRHIKFQRIKRPDTDRGGYYTYKLRCLDGKIRNLRAARLVAAAFIGDIPSGYVVDHIDRIRQNDNVDNLRIVTQSENSQNRKYYDRNGVCRIIDLHKKGFSVDAIVAKLNP